MSDSTRKTPKLAANDMTILLRTALGGDRLPVDVEALAYEVSGNNEDPITTIRCVDIDGFEGMLRARRNKPGWQILYNIQPRYRGRERFTLAHEFGHYILHRRPLTADDYRDGELSGAVDFECLPLQADEWRDAEKEREEEADIFASYLLMPIDDYRNQVNGEEMTRGLLDHVTHRYGVSLLAAVHKWIEFTDARAAMIVARDGLALWGRASTAAYETGIFIRSGMAIPDRSIAALGPTAQSAEDGHATALPEGIWTFSQRSEPVRELAIFSSRLDFSISVLLFEENSDSLEIGDEETLDVYDQICADGRS